MISHTSPCKTGCVALFDGTSHLTSRPSASKLLRLTTVLRRTSTRHQSAAKCADGMPRCELAHGEAPRRKLRAELARGWALVLNGATLPSAEAEPFQCNVGPGVVRASRPYETVRCSGAGSLLQRRAAARPARTGCSTGVGPERLRSTTRRWMTGRCRATSATLARLRTQSGSAG